MFAFYMESEADISKRGGRMGRKRWRSSNLGEARGLKRQKNSPPQEMGLFFYPGQPRVYAGSVMGVR